MPIETRPMLGATDPPTAPPSVPFTREEVRAIQEKASLRCGLSRWGAWQAYARLADAADAVDAVLARDLLDAQKK